MQIRVSTRRVFVANARKRTNTPCVSHTMEHFYDSCDRKATVATNTEHQPVSVCDCRIAEHNYKVQEQLKSRAHKECMAKIGRYVGRALDRLTVTTMLLCSDSAPKILAGRPASAGLPFLLRCAVLRCVMSCDVPNRVAMWISVDDTPRVWITHILRPQVPFRLESMCGFVFQSAV